MDKLLTIVERPKESRPLPLAMASAPRRAIDCVLHDDTVVKKLRDWLLDRKTDAGFVTAPCGSGLTTFVNLLIHELCMVSHVVDHTAKDFAALLEESNTVECDVVILDGFDDHVGKRIIDAVVAHVRTASHKLVCMGHGGRKSTSNLFASKWKKFHLVTSSKKTLAVLELISGGRAPKDVLRRIAATTPTDLRACINSLEMYMFRPGSDVETRDEFTDVIDAIERVFSRSGYGSFDSLYKTFEHEPLSIAGGVHENYLRSVKRIEDVCVISDNMSIGDVFSLAHEDFTHRIACCVCSVGYTHSCEHKSEIRVDKFGTAFSKNALRLANKKRLAAHNTKRAAKGLQSLSAVDVGLNMTVKLRTSRLS